MKAYERRTMPLIDFFSGLGLQERGENQAIEKNVDFRNARLSSTTGRHAVKYAVHAAP